MHADFVSLPAFARRMPPLQQSSNRSNLLPSGPTAANVLRWVCCCGPTLQETEGRTDGRTEGRTPYRFIDLLRILCEHVPVSGQ